MNAFHREILNLILSHSGTPTKHTFLDDYLGNTHPRYPINAPTLRSIAKTWMKNHLDELSPKNFVALITSLIKGKSSTEKVMAGILLDYSPASLHDFDPVVFNQWLDHLQGWAEVDNLCTGAYAASAIPADFAKWKKLLTQFAKNKMIEKRRASIVLLCSPLRKAKDERLVEIVFQNIQLLKAEKEVLITKAISWVLRCAIKHHKKAVSDFVKANSDSLPKIAVRETLTVLKTGKKTKTKPS
jgi:3-methyladenine DNA glycosylase AlkD